MQSYVFSTVSTNLMFCQYSATQKNRYPAVLRKVIIKGGANVAQGGGNKGLWTPKGVATPVSDADLAFLNTDPLFQKKIKEGFLSVGFAEADAERAALDMTPKDKSAPKTPADFGGDKTGRSVKEIVAA